MRTWRDRTANERTVITLGILLACCPCAFALNPSLDINQYSHKAWTVREGFFKGSTTSIAQTPDGYLWLGTEFGLLRFDGVRFVSWQPPTGQHLPRGRIRTLLSARDGRLWIGTDEGLASLKDGKLTQYAELAGQVVVSLLEDREGTIWAGGYALPNGRLCAIQGYTARCYGEDGAFGHGVSPLYEDTDGHVWAGSLRALWRWKPGPPRLFPIPDARLGINALIEGDHGALLMSVQTGIRQFVDGKVEAYPLPGAPRQFKPGRLLRDRNGGLWIGTFDRGLLHVHAGRTDLFARSDGLSGDFVENLFEDREGNIWVATVDGLDRFRDFAIHTITTKQGLSNATVESVLAAKDGSIWLGTLNGLDKLNNGVVTIYGKRNGLPDDTLDSLFQDERGRIWASTPRGLHTSRMAGLFAQMTCPPGAVHSIVGDGAGNLWLSHAQSLFQLRLGNLAEGIPKPPLGRKDYALSLLPDPRQGGLWLGFFQGGVAYFKDGQIRLSYGGTDGLGDGPVNRLQLDPDGTLWAATQVASAVQKTGVSPR